MTGMAGTFHWMAPEVLSAANNYTYKADVYSYGIVLWEIMAREPPFKTLRHHEIATAVVAQQMRPDMNLMHQSCPANYKTLVQRCWSQNPEDRPDFNIIVKCLTAIEKEFV